MTLRIKAAIVLGITLVTLIIVLYLLSSVILGAGFRALEDEDAQLNMTRVISALTDEIEDLSTLTHDWAAWDDTYEFINDGNQAYIDSNLVDTTFIDTPLNILIFVDSTGKIVFGEAFDLETEEHVPLPEGLIEHISGNGLLLQHTKVPSSVTGLLDLPIAPLIVSSRPIVTSRVEGPIRGTLILGQYLDAARVEALGDTTHLTLASHRMNDPALPVDFTEAIPHITIENQQFVKPMNERTISGYAVANDIYGAPLLMFRADIERATHAQGVSITRYFLLAILLAGLGFGAVTLLLLEKFVLSRLSGLSTVVTSIAQSGDLSAQVKLQGSDELATLGSDIDDMLRGLENAEHRRLEDEEKIKASLKEKEILLNEVHHRVKNNLQVVSSLLNLQSRDVQDERMVQLFRESRDRIMSMALIHEKLYQSNDLERIDFGDYVRGLTANLYASYGARMEDVKLNIDAADAYLTLDKAIPCGLIINELVSNSMKHGVVENRGAEIDIRFRQDGDSCELTVKDNGVGFPKDFNFENTRSLGLKLVSALATQLKGAAELLEGKGA
ncbi:MAG: CHASE4 domain-containing protein, partial [SAR202 cluster bacterium]|nr:CHASE4 domain-containing protein [SAR202 cluster bacterium]